MDMLLPPPHNFITSIIDDKQLDPSTQFQTCQETPPLSALVKQQYAHFSSLQQQDKNEPFSDSLAAIASARRGVLCLDCEPKEVPQTIHDVQIVGLH
jgi:hypothetical protein